jgi:hypothetical protein
MTKKKIERLSVIHRREINWLKWYFLRDKKNPKRTILEQKIIVSHIKNDRLEAKFLSNLKKSTEDFIDGSDPKYLQAIKEVYVYENMNVIGACQKILFYSPTQAYVLLNAWFNDYFRSTYTELLENAILDKEP